MSQNSLRNATEAAKDPSRLGTTNQHVADEQVKEIKDQEKERKAQAKFDEKNRNSVGDIVAEQGPASVYAQEHTAIDHTKDNK